MKVSLMDQGQGCQERIALCIDLDGTLLKSSVLCESVLALLSKNPLYLFLLPIWLLRGKAALKHEIADRIDLDVTTLPYDERVVEMLKSTQARPRVLCTATNSKYAAMIAEHLGVFDLVIASGETSIYQENTKRKCSYNVLVNGASTMQATKTEI